jgi:hypothetical protein
LSRQDSFEGQLSDLKKQESEDKKVLPVQSCGFLAPPTSEIKPTRPTRSTKLTRQI